MPESAVNYLFGKNIVVTGAAGCMGTAALKRLAQIDGVRLTVVYRKTEPASRPAGATFIQADLTDMATCSEVVQGADVVFHFAGVLSTAPILARDPVSHIRHNLTINSQMLEAAHQAGVQKFIWLSSSTGYPDMDRLLVEDDFFTGEPVGVNYQVGWMNRYTETLSRTFAEKVDRPMSIVALRPTTIYGERESFDPAVSHVLPAMVRKVALRHNPIEIWGDGQGTRDWVYATDVFEACLATLTKVESFDVFNFGSGRETSINELVSILIRIDGFENAKIVYVGGKPQTVKKRQLDLTKSNRVLGHLEKTDLETVLKKMLHAFRNAQNQFSK